MKPEYRITKKDLMVLTKEELGAYVNSVRPYFASVILLSATIRSNKITASKDMH